MDMEYYAALENLIRAMTDLNEFKLEKIYAPLTELCKIFRVSKGVTTFYESLQHERRGKGEVFVCFDSGEKCKEVLTKRIVTEALSVAVCSVYMPEDAEPWSDLERSRVELIENTVLTFISRSRLKALVERLTFYDDDGYRNLRYYISHVERLGYEGRLSGKAAIRYNLKHFSLVNQQIGRHAGNIVMKTFYEQLKKLVGANGLVCRIGGDNYAILCEKTDLDQVLEYLSGSASIVYDVNSGDSIGVQATAGVYEIPDDPAAQNIGEIMDRITSTAQAAKNGDHGDIVFYSEDMMVTRERLMRIQQMFPEALKNEEFLVYYQPKIAVGSNTLTGAEALCRWEHDGQLISPVDFIPMLEQSMDICKLDFYMLDHVCKDIRRWLDEGKQVVRVSVNLSRKHMLDADLFRHIVDIVDQNHVPHEYIEIELTETTTDVEFRDLKRVVNSLQSAGIYTSVDDFGIGYSSLNLIKEMPWNVLKVDRSFLPEDGDDEHSHRSIMFKYVIAMAREMGLECVAEGVETITQVKILEENSCDIAQGFYFDKPLPVSEYEKRMDLHTYQLH